MADKTPVRVVYNSSNVATGLAEFQSAESVGYAFGGTGLTSLGSAGQVLKVNAAGTAMEFGAEGDISITNLVAPTNADLKLTTSGTGNIVLDAITIRGTTLSAADSSTININEGLIVDGTASVSGTLTASTSLALATGATVTGILDEDAMGTNSATQLATQQSIKQYSDAATQTLTNKTLTSPKVNEDVVMSSTATELNLLDGLDATYLAVPGKLAGTNFTGSLLVGHTTTGTLDSADNNLGVGIEALDAITSGDQNVALGKSSLTALTTGHRNVGVGARTLISNSTGIENVMIGNDAGYNITGNRNVGFGNDSLAQVVAGAYNIGIGNQAGDNITSGSGNVIIGAGIDATSATGARQLKIAGFDGSTTTTWIDGDSSGNLTFAATATATTFTTAGSNAISVTDNAITTASSNADINITPHGTGDINLTAGADVNIPANIGLTFGDDGEKIEGDGTNLSISSSASLSFDSGTNITTFSAGGTGFLQLQNDSGNTWIRNTAQDKDIKFVGNDGGGTITALVIDMSEAGAAIFNGTVTATSFVTTGNAVTIADNNITTGTSNADINITPHGTGSVVISQVSTNSVTGEVIPGKFAGTNFTGSLLVGHATTGTLSTATYNTGVGLTALDALTSGDFNTAVGYNAGTGMTASTGNTAMGYDSMVSTAGNNNSAYGYNSLKQNLNAHNTAMGAYAADAMTNGSSNTAMGYSALGAAITSGNTAIGAESLILATGQHNTALGKASGDNITSGSGNVIIGNVDADSATDSRQLVIAGYDGSSTTTWIKGVSSGAITFNSAYTFPTADGDDGQALVTDGSGTLTFGTVGAASASDDSLGVGVANKIITSTARTIDSFHATFQDSAFYMVVSNDHYEDCINVQAVSLCHNNTTAFVSSSGVISKAGGTDMTAFTTDISNDMVRLKAASTNAVGGRASFYKFGLGDNSSAATSGNVIVTINADVDSASEALVSFAHASYRGAKLFISINNDSKTEVGNIEALVVHDGTTGYITTYNQISSGNNDLIALTGAISGSNFVVSAAGYEPNLRVTVHAIMLKDTMVTDAGTYNNTEAIAPVTISSTATEVDTLIETTNNGAMYYFVSKNASEGTYAVNEVFVALGSGECAIANAGFVSTKGTNQLAFTSDYKDDVEATASILAASTSGGSTTVSAYRLNALAN
jgi:hypothetical protein